MLHGRVPTSSKKHSPVPMDVALDSSACWTKGTTSFVLAFLGTLVQGQKQVPFCTSHSGLKKLPPQSSVSVTVSGKNFPVCSHIIWHILEELSFQGGYSAADASLAHKC